MVFSWAVFSFLSAQGVEGPEVVGRATGVEISRTQLQEAVRDQLQALEMERRQFEAKMKLKRQEVLEKTTDQLLLEKIVELEAAKRNTTKEQMILDEVDNKITEPTAEEIETFYEANKNRIRGSKEEVLPQVGPYLKQQKRQELTQSFLGGLQKAYEATVLLEPLRFEVEAQGFPATGPENAPVVIVEFSDFQCPFCSKFKETLDQVVTNYPDQVRLVFRQFPLLSIHPQAQKAAEASLCAADQGKFWEMHDRMFEDPKKLSVEALKESAGALGLEAAAFGKCLDSGKYAAQVRADLLAGSGLGVTGTPAVFVNGRPLSGAVPYEQVAQIIDEELKKKMEEAEKTR